MSFYCEVLKKTVIGQPLHKVVVEKRTKEYKDEEDNVIGVGSEIKKEINVCAEGLKIFEAQNQEQ